MVEVAPAEEEEKEKKVGEDGLEIEEEDEEEEAEKKPTTEKVRFSSFLLFHASYSCSTYIVDG
jgi:hypothetical protein